MLRFVKQDVEKVILLFIILIGATLRICNLSELSFSNDELSALLRTQYDSFTEFLNKGIYADINPAGVQLFLYLWVKIFGTSVFMFRLPFVITGILSIYISYLVAEKWFNKYTGLFVAAAVCFLEFPLLYSQQARPFEPALLFCTMSCLYWTKILFENKTNWKNIFLLAFSLCLAAYTHYFTLAFISVLLLTGTFFLKRENLRAYFLSILLAIILYIPNIIVIVEQFESSASIDWLTIPDNDWFFKHFMFLFNDSKLLLYMVFTLFIITNIYSFTDVKFGKFHILSVVLFFLPFIIGFYYSKWFKPVLENTVLLCSFPFLIFFIFSFIHEKNKKLNFYLLAIFFIVGLFSTIFENKYYTRYHFGEIKDIAAKTIEWNNKYGDKNVTKVININSPYYINYYLDKNNEKISFAMYRNRGENDLKVLFDIVKKANTPYFLYAWTGVENPDETEDIIKSKYRFVRYYNDYNNMANIAMYSIYSDSTIKERQPVYYIFNGFEGKETWDKDTDIITTDIVYDGNYSAKLDFNDKYGPAYANRISKITNKSFSKIRIYLWAYIADNFKDAQIVATLNLKDEENQIYENYFWRSCKLEYFLEKNKWGQVFLSFDMPELRSRNDELKVYVWNPGGQTIYIDNFELKAY